MTINLNADDYEGGDLRFPEFGPRTYRAPTGGAVVFSCSLLHEATPVTRGRALRLPAVPLRRRGGGDPRGEQQFLDNGVGAYRIAASQPG